MKITNIFKCTQKEFDTMKTRDQVSLLCTQCNEIYFRSKKDILDTFNRY